MKNKLKNKRLSGDRLPVDNQRLSKHHINLDTPLTTFSSNQSAGKSSVRPSAQMRFSSPCQPSRWNTFEFYIYYVILGAAIIWGFGTGYLLSTESHPNYQNYKHLLSKGWLFHRQVDNSDFQYAGFRNNFPPLLLVAFLHVLVSSVIQKLTATKKTYQTLQQVNSPSPSLKKSQLWIFFSLIFSVVFQIALHGTKSIIITVIIIINYGIGKGMFGMRLSPFLTWIFNISVLFLNEHYNGYTFSNISSHLAVLDTYNGLFPRWHIIFNITTLRLISFNMDFYWRQQPKIDEQALKYGWIDPPYFPEQYSFANYVLYLFYPPLYIAGPIITYNDFMSQVYGNKKVEFKEKIWYLLRTAFDFLCIELLMHFTYTQAISKVKHWELYSPSEISMVAYINLKFVWFKLLVIWRFFRCWALFDNINAPENMVRCMSNNYSAIGFWKTWHRSYNRWLVRYIYIPLGGSKYAMYNIWIVFTFVAMWHDISLNLLAWSWIICLFILPEMVATKLLPEKKSKKYHRMTGYRHLCALGAVFNIFTMMVGNLVGFAVGMEGVKAMLEKIFDINGLKLLFSIVAVFYVSAQIMFEVREQEKRNLVEKDQNYED